MSQRTTFRILFRITIVVHLYSATSKILGSRPLIELILRKHKLYEFIITSIWRQEVCRKKKVSDRYIWRCPLSLTFTTDIYGVVGPPYHPLFLLPSLRLWFGLLVNEGTSLFSPTILQQWMKRDLQRDLDPHSLNIIVKKEKLQKVATS